MVDVVERLVGGLLSVDVLKGLADELSSVGVTEGLASEMSSVDVVEGSVGGLASAGGSDDGLSKPQVSLAHSRYCSILTLKWWPLPWAA